MRIYVIAFALILILAGSAFSDIVYFKDGGEIEGIVKEEAGGYVVIDMGVGTMSVRRDEIDYIKKATPQELRQLEKKKICYEIERGKWAPPGYRDVGILYRRIKDDRETLREARRKSEAIGAEISQREKRVSELLSALDKKGRELKAIDAEKKVKKYNEIVAEMNLLNAALNKARNTAKNLYEQEKKLNVKLAKLADNYRSNFELFTNVLSKQRSDIGRDEMTPDELYFFETMESKASEMAGDFRRDVTLYTPEGSHIVVDTLINGNVSVRLMVDTGASIVVISGDVASRLGIKYEDIHTEIEIIMADGSSVQAKPIILKSVKVGKAEVKNVQAAILDSGDIGGADGLLGMSFLSHFVIKVDSASNKLILERIL